MAVEINMIYNCMVEVCWYNVRGPILSFRTKNENEAKKIMAKGPAMGLWGLRGLSVSNDWIQCNVIGVPKRVISYFALKEEVLLTFITGTPKKDSAFVQTTHLSLISLDLALKRWAAHTFIGTLTFSFCSGFAKMLSSSFNEFHKREFCLL